LNSRLEAAFRSADREGLEKLVTQYGIRRVNLASIEISTLFKEGITESQILDLLTFLADSGFTLRDNLGPLAT
jgi:hypothetical protein